MLLELDNLKRKHRKETREAQEQVLKVAEDEIKILLDEIKMLRNYIDQESKKTTSPMQVSSLQTELVNTKLALEQKTLELDTQLRTNKQLNARLVKLENKTWLENELSR